MPTQPTHISPVTAHKAIGTSFLARLHAKLGDFWWYSLMLFCAARLADCMNVFVGLWLVPKYVPPAELGAVQPLTNFATFLSIPIAVFASTFRQELTNLAVSRQFGKLKTLMRGVFVATAAFLFLSIVTCRFVMPLFLERIRIVEGSLGILVLACSFVGAVSPIYTNALQSLRKFKTNSAISLLGAPIRLLAMIAAMPFRALSGYFVGQMSTPAFAIVAAIVGLRKELSVPAKPYWNRDVLVRCARLFAVLFIGSAAGGFSLLVETTVLRQRLPEMDSAAYYVATRFSDIAGFLVSALTFTIFPFAAELASKGKDTRPIMIKASLAVIVTNALLALALGLFGRQVLAVLPHGSEYADYWWSMPWLVGIVTTSLLCNLYTTGELAANRFGYMWWMVPLCILYPVALLFVTGYGYFVPYMPASWTEFLASHNVRSLDAMLWWMTGVGIVKITCCALDMAFQRRAD